MKTKKHTLLVAAAPEMLAALEKARDALFCLCHDAGDVAEWNEGGVGYEAISAVRRAIARAKGKPE